MPALHRSAATLVDWVCPKCKHSNRSEITLIVDTQGCPDLLDKIIQGTLNTPSCQNCKLQMHVDSSLLIYRPGKNPTLIFSPVDNLAVKNKFEGVEQLIHFLQQNLGDEWQKAWLQQMPSVPRRLLPMVLTEGLEAAARHSQELIKKMAATYEEINAITRPQDMPRRIDLCNKALQGVDRYKDPIVWITYHAELANSLAQNPFGDRADNLEKAIQHIGQALEVCIRQNSPEEWARHQTNLAIFYFQRILGDRADNIERAISIYNSALEILTKEKSAERWAWAQCNLANAYWARINGDKTENIEQAILHHNMALEVHTRQAYPKEWSGIQNDLANAYVDRIQGNKSENIEQAIHHFTQALEIRTRQAYPELWASTLNNQARAYMNRIHGDRAENIEQAIHQYEMALDVYTRQSNPERWASIQNNLASAYDSRLLGKRSENIEHAIKLHEMALQILTEQAFPEIWATTQTNLSGAYADRIRGKREENIEEAIRHQDMALKVFQRHSYHQQCAMAQNNLATHFRERTYGNKADNIEQAIKYHEMNLETYKRDAFPEFWAMTHTNLALDYKDRVYGKREDNLKQAIHHFSLALEWYKPKSYPIHCRGAARGLGEIYMKNGLWEEASRAFHTAIQADETLFQSSLSAETQETGIWRAGDLYPNAAYTLMRTGKYDEALQIIEFGRSRILRDSLERDRKDLEQLQEQGHAELYKRYQESSRRFKMLLLSINRTQTRISQDQALTQLDYLKQQENAQADIYAAVDAIRRIPGFEQFMQCPSANQIRTMATQQPLIYLTITPIGGLAVLVNPTSITPLWLDNLTDDALLRQMFGDAIPSQLGGHLGTYGDYRMAVSNKNAPLKTREEAYERWLSSLENITEWLWKTCMGPIMQTLGEQGCRRAVLIPGGLLSLLPLPAAWTVDHSTPSGRRYALDSVAFSYAPSAYALQKAQSGATRPANSILAIDNPDGSIQVSKLEVDAVLAHFPPKAQTRLLDKKADKNSVLLAMSKNAVLHFSTHGIADFSKPLESYLLLAYEERLTLRDVFDMKLDRARLAVLAACETSVTGGKALDEAISLPAGFLQAGVPGIVGSLWSVEAVSTMLLMARFYKLWLKDGMQPCDALHKAQIWLRDCTAGELKAFLQERMPEVNVLRSPIGSALKTYWNIARFSDRDRPFAHLFYWAAFGYTGV
jgi:CHAT domain-containing protein